MAGIEIPGSNSEGEYNNDPSDPGGAQSILGNLQSGGIRVNTFDGTENYTQCRRVGSTSIAGEINKTYYDNLS